MNHLAVYNWYVILSLTHNKLDFVIFKVGCNLDIVLNYRSPRLCNFHRVLCFYTKIRLTINKIRLTNYPAWNMRLISMFT